jgi:hypothetical protein
MSRFAPAADVADWLKPHLQWITLPSWGMSLLLHAATIFVMLMVSRMPGCQADVAGDNGESFQEVGIYLRPNSVPLADTLSESNAETSETQPVEQAAEAAPQAVSDSPPVKLSLPSLDAPPVIGGGPPRMSTGLNDLLSPTRPGTAPAPPAAGGGPNATAMFGIEDAGNRFVYVIDTSSSMANYGALRVAKMELLASLERLEESQQFQLIFCNSEELLTLGQGRFNMFSGTDTHRLEVQLQIAGIGADNGTEHYAAIEAALKTSPDVVFYLTDAGEPFLTPAELEDIRRLNRGTRIHCIEFGQGSLTEAGQAAGNFLKKLADQNDGRYTYRDVTTFRR